MADIHSIEADSALPVTPARPSPAASRASPSSKTPQPRVSEIPGSRRVTRRASDSTIKGHTEKFADRGDKGSDNEGFTFGGLIKAVKSVRQKMVLFCGDVLGVLFVILSQTGQIFWWFSHK